MTSPERLQSLGYTCREHDPLPDEDGTPTRLFYIHAPDGRATGAYGETPERAWEAAVGLMNYRHSGDWPHHKDK